MFTGTLMCKHRRKGGILSFYVRPSCQYPHMQMCAQVCQPAAPWQPHPEVVMVSYVAFNSSVRLERKSRSAASLGAAEPHSSAFKDGYSAPSMSFAYACQTNTFNECNLLYLHTAFFKTPHSIVSKTATSRLEELIHANAGFGWWTALKMLSLCNHLGPKMLLLRRTGSTFRSSPTLMSHAM